MIISILACCDKGCGKWLGRCGGNSVCSRSCCMYALLWWWSSLMTVWSGGSTVACTSWERFSGCEIGGGFAFGALFADTGVSKVEIGGTANFFSLKYNVLHCTVMKTFLTLNTKIYTTRVSSCLKQRRIQDFLKGAPTPKPIFFWSKTTWKWKNLESGGVHPWCPPWICQSLIHWRTRTWIRTRIKLVYHADDFHIA